MNKNKIVPDTERNIIISENSKKLAQFFCCIYIIIISK